MPSAPSCSCSSSKPARSPDPALPPYPPPTPSPLLTYRIRLCPCCPMSGTHVAYAAMRALGV
eukprot:1479389-Rhodomonas_salina.1